MRKFRVYVDDIQFHQFSKVFSADTLTEARQLARKDVDSTPDSLTDIDWEDEGSRYAFEYRDELDEEV